jgi:hypothetical protein
LFFSVATADVVKAVRNLNSSAILYMYADDMVTGANNRKKMQRAFDEIVQ